MLAVSHAWRAALQYTCFAHLNPMQVNHGVSNELIERMQQQMRAFFALPFDVKLQIKRSTVNPNGYFNDERTKQVGCGCLPGPPVRQCARVGRPARVDRPAAGHHGPARPPQHIALWAD